MSASAPIRVDPSKLRHIALRALALRFAFGAAVSVVAGLVGGRWGPVAGGIFLAFPAVLAATLTLIETEERDRILAAQDARGAVLGAIGMIAFALCVWALAPRVSAIAALGVATVVWAVVATALYRLTWGSRQGRRLP
ncbi:DUF3147 family protein [Sphaerisporangium album]|uniref:DUF3147 family protein n=1 Tax=Sphaerisporangium album TaxID=509200 RepID=A0A367FT82_9ACTN|nr:DUF3147 family protein [Sphaerisporangium album]RCG33139.1 DUF3147 family protein [Sphaerisporangium album]